MDMSASAWQPVEASLSATQPEVTWVEPILDGQVLRSTGDPAELAVERESIRLAFVAALQHLPPRQRAVLILRDVLRWKADEVAELLESSVASVNSALQRARATLGSERVREAPTAAPLNDDDEALLARYVEAFESYDIDGFVALLHEDATQNMPPYEMWLQGRADIGAWMVGPGHGCRGSRLIPTRANGRPAFAHYRPSGPGGRHEPFALRGARAGGRQGRGHHELPRHEAVPAAGSADLARRRLTQRPGSGRRGCFDEFWSAPGSTRHDFDDDHAQSGRPGGSGSAWRCSRCPRCCCRST